METEQKIKAAVEEVDDPRIEVAVERTLLAYERTQLAWIRTVLALITAGIAIDKGTEALHQARIAMGEAFIKSGYFSGMLLTISGTVMMILTTVSNFLRMRELDRIRAERNKLPYPIFILSCVISLFGILVIIFLSLA